MDETLVVHTQLPQQGSSNATLPFFPRGNRLRRDKDIGCTVEIPMASIDGLLYAVADDFRYAVESFGRWAYCNRNRRSVVRQGLTPVHCYMFNRVHSRKGKRFKFKHLDVECRYEIIIVSVLGALVVYYKATSLSMIMFPSLLSVQHSYLTAMKGSTYSLPVRTFSRRGVVT
ncbi:hypothetical protein BT69DRAFT_293217 [Atractiella rhizophila]|nr:hypothetical protein BT69DRAFT_293217 [Atractiella rhizophila]